VDVSPILAYSTLRISILEIRVYVGVKTCEGFLRFLAIVRVRIYYVHFFVFFVLRHSGSYTEDEPEIKFTKSEKASNKL